VSSSLAQTDSIIQQATKNTTGLTGELAVGGVDVIEATSTIADTLSPLQDMLEQFTNAVDKIAEVRLGASAALHYSMRADTKRKH
jgi:hypothetical protein